MIENDAQKPNTSPPHVKSNSPEELSEPVEEPDQRQQGEHRESWPRNETIRVVVLCVGLLLVILSYLFFRFTGNVLPLFVTIVVVYLFYRWLDIYLDRSMRGEYMSYNEYSPMLRRGRNLPTHYEL